MPVAQSNIQPKILLETLSKILIKFSSAQPRSHLVWWPLFSPGSSKPLPLRIVWWLYHPNLWILHWFCLVLWLSSITHSQVLNVDQSNISLWSFSYPFSKDHDVNLSTYLWTTYPCGLMEVDVIFGSLMSLKAYQSRAHGWFLLILNNIVSIFGW